jgi:hypothetical protein
MKRPIEEKTEPAVYDGIKYMIPVDAVTLRPLYDYIYFRTRNIAELQDKDIANMVVHIRQESIANIYLCEVYFEK